MKSTDLILLQAKKNAFKKLHEPRIIIVNNDKSSTRQYEFDIMGFFNFILGLWQTQTEELKKMLPQGKSAGETFSWCYRNVKRQ